MTYRKKPDINLLPKDEQRALLAVAKAETPQEMRAALLDLAALRCAKVRKADRDKAADKRTRVLVGARVPREEAWMIAKAANLKGMSLYRFCRNSLLDQAQEVLADENRTLVCLQVERGAW